MALSLRPRQDECLDSIRNEYLAGCYQQLVVAATGIGKEQFVEIGKLLNKMRTN